MTPSSKPVTRLTSAYVRDKGMRPVVATITGGFLELRAKGLRSREVLDLAWCYQVAVKMRIAHELAQKRAARRQRRS
jgi:hypothetical protein